MMARVRAWVMARRRRRELVEADAVALIARYGSDAYNEARERGIAELRTSVIDGNRPADHWQQVGRVIARTTGRPVGIDTATRMTTDV